MIPTTACRPSLLRRRAALLVRSHAFRLVHPSIPAANEIKHRLPIEITALATLDLQDALDFRSVLPINWITRCNAIVIRLVHPVRKSERLERKVLSVLTLGALKLGVHALLGVKQGNTGLELGVGLFARALRLVARIAEFLDLSLDSGVMLAERTEFIFDSIVAGSARYPRLGFFVFIALPMAIGFIPALVVDLSGIGPFIKPFVSFIFDAINVVLWFARVSHNKHPYR